MQSFQTRTKELNKAIDVTENSMKDISSQLKNDVRRTTYKCRSREITSRIQ